MQPTILPFTGLLRLRQILGDKKAGTTPIIPVSRDTWYKGIKTGRYPQPVRIGARAVAWRAEDVLKLVQEGVQ